MRIDPVFAQTTAKFFANARLIRPTSKIAPPTPKAAVRVFDIFGFAHDSVSTFAGMRRTVNLRIVLDFASYPSYGRREFCR